MSLVLQIHVGQFSPYAASPGTLPGVALFAVIEDTLGCQYWERWTSEAAFFKALPTLEACKEFLREQMDLEHLEDLEAEFPGRYSIDRIFDSAVVIGMPPAWAPSGVPE